MAASVAQVKRIAVDLVSLAVDGSVRDATRRVESIGFVLVRVLTDDGLTGVGMTYHEVGGQAIRLIIERDIAPHVIGRSAFETEVIWQEVVKYTRGVGRKGLVFAALSAVDIALWDIKAKHSQLPMYRYLGGASPRVPIYASGGWTSLPDSELVDEAIAMVDHGYQRLKVKVGVEAGTNPLRDVARVRAVREAVGEDIRITLDANNCWDASTAVAFANRAREYDIEWIEEPTPADDIPGLRRFRRGTDVPLATGEHEYTKYGVRDLILAEAVDVVQADGTRAGGYTEMLKIAALVESWNLRYAPHAMELIHGPLVSASSAGLTLERLLLFEQLTQGAFPEFPRPAGGYLTLPDTPGLGLTIDQDWVAGHADR